MILWTSDLQNIEKARIFFEDQKKIARALELNNIKVS